MHTVTLDLPEEVYRLAQATARSTRRPVAQVLAEWICPPTEAVSDRIDGALAGLEEMSTDQLTEAARFRLPGTTTDRLRELLSLQPQRDLTLAEQHELAGLVNAEDLETLRKARALVLLKQRGALPDDLRALLS